MATVETDPIVEPSDLLQAVLAVRNGDFSVRLPAHWTGLQGKIADAFNAIVESNARMASELERVGTVVGKQGKARQRVRFGPSGGAWSAMEASVNTLIDDLLWPTTEVTRALAAVAKGDLRQTVRLDVDGRPLEGEFLRSATIVNGMIEQLGVCTSEVTRVAREVGTDGKLGGQAEVSNVSGVWKELTDSVNSMASNLTGQVRNISDVTIAVANGDLSRKITVDVRGEILLLKEAINTMVDQLRSFAGEVTRVAREVGTEGRLGGQAVVPGVAGTWKDLTDSVNAMARNLTDQVRNIAEVTTAVARGDLSRKITVDVRGEILELKNTINTMVDQLNGFASEVTRVAREVGTDGKLGGQAQVPGVAGTWKDLTDNVNLMASNLTAQVRNIAEVATAIARGDLSRKITVNVSGEILLLKDTINTMVDQLNAFASEVTRVAWEVGTDGRLGGQAKVPGVAGTWKDLTDSVNSMANNLTAQVRNIAEVATAIAGGDLSKKITVDVSGEILQLKITVNTMVDQLNAFAGEVTRVAREVGTEGKLGGQAQVPGVAGTWKDLTDNVNLLAANLTTQVRNIAEVTTAVARGNLSRKITVQVRGEVLELKDTINTMVDQLNAFAAEVTRVAREVGTDGKLGGQAQVPGVGGTWKDLTDNVNLLAANLTTQVRAIAEVATAVTKGDLTRSIQMDACGEVAELKDNINTMIGNLRLTTDRNTEQDWLKTNLAAVTGMLQGQRDLATVGEMLLGELVPLLNGHQGVIYQMDSGQTPQLKLLASYAAAYNHPYPPILRVGEGLVGECARAKRRILVSGVPSDTIPVDAVFFEALPRNILVFPVIFEGRLKAVIGLASLSEFSPPHVSFLEQLTASIGIVLNSIEATMQTEALLTQSQQLAGELQTQQRALERLNSELEQRVAERTAALEATTAALHEGDRRKDEFLAILAHELRNPLAPIRTALQLMRQSELAESQRVRARDVIERQMEHLVTLVDDLLDVSRITRGMVTLQRRPVSVAGIMERAVETTRPAIDARRHELALELPDEPISIDGDETRLVQVIGNILHNAAKFTDVGGRILVQATREDSSAVITVKDTGIGIPREFVPQIFELFAQAHTNSACTRGGLGIGLALVRRLVEMHGGTVMAESDGPGHGTAFTIRLPLSTTATASPTQPPTGSPTIPSIQPTRILVADDNRDAAELLELQLQLAGHDVRLAHDGVEALAVAESYQPVLVLLDLGMPRMDGCETARKMRQRPWAKQATLIALTGWGQEQDRQRTAEAGFDAHLVKPVSERDLFQALAATRAQAPKGS